MWVSVSNARVFPAKHTASRDTRGWEGPVQNKHINAASTVFVLSRPRPGIRFFHPSCDPISKESLKMLARNSLLLFQGRAFYLLFAFLLQTDFPLAPAVPTANFTFLRGAAPFSTFHVAPHEYSTVRCLQKASSAQRLRWTAEVRCTPSFFFGNRAQFYFFSLLLLKRRQARRLHVDSTDFAPPTADLRFTAVTFCKTEASCVAVGWTAIRGFRMTVMESIVICTTLEEDKTLRKTKFWLNYWENRYFALFKPALVDWPPSSHCENL